MHSKNLDTESIQLLTQDQEDVEVIPTIATSANTRTRIIGGIHMIVDTRGMIGEMKGNMDMRGR